METATQDFVISILSAAGVSATLSVVVVWLARNWLSERLRNSIRHEYDLKLAAVNQSLQVEADARTTQLRASIEREADKLRFATSTIGESQRLVILRRIESVDTLWQGTLAVRKNAPVVMGFIDILTVDEYMGMADHPNFKSLVGEVSQERLSEMFADNVGSLERVRPYVGEYLWALFSTYQAVILRIALLIQLGEADPKKLNWHKDAGILQLLVSSMTKSEIKQLDLEKIGKVGWLQRNYESKILKAIDIVLAGDKFGDEALRQAQEMEKRIDEIRRTKLNHANPDL